MFLLGIENKIENRILKQKWKIMKLKIKSKLKLKIEFKKMYEIIVWKKNWK